MASGYDEADGVEDQDVSVESKAETKDVMRRSKSFLLVLNKSRELTSES